MRSWKDVYATLFPEERKRPEKQKEVTKEVKPQFNITLNELKRAVAFAERNGESKHKTITLLVDSNGIGSAITAVNLLGGVSEDITEIESW